jgi:hypothetical protein
VAPPAPAPAAPTTATPTTASLAAPAPATPMTASPAPALPAAASPAAAAPALAAAAPGGPVVYVDPTTISVAHWARLGDGELLAREVRRVGRADEEGLGLRGSRDVPVAPQKCE